MGFPSAIFTFSKNTANGKATSRAAWKITLTTIIKISKDKFSAELVNCSSSLCCCTIVSTSEREGWKWYGDYPRVAHTLVNEDHCLAWRSAGLQHCTRMLIEQSLPPNLCDYQEWPLACAKSSTVPTQQRRGSGCSAKEPFLTLCSLTA